jgi:hypothetical protein
MWNRWKAGQSLHEIGRALGKDHVVIQFLLARHGGIAPPVRRRSRRVLTLAEREDISRGIASGCSMRVIDLQKLSSDYKYAAKHPMVGDPCSRAVFDPLQMADLPGGAWARGAIVRGYAFRPPLAIEIRINSDQLVAAAME